MNSTLPNFKPAPGPVAGSSRSHSAPLDGYQADPAGDKPPAILADFATLMPVATPASAGAVSTTAGTATAGAATAGQPSVVTGITTGRPFTSGRRANPPTETSESATNLTAVPTSLWGRVVLTAESTPTGAETPQLPEIPATPLEVPQEIREQAAALMVSLLQTLQPESPLVPLSGRGTSESSASDLVPDVVLPACSETGTGAQPVSGSADSVVDRAVSNFETVTGRSTPVVDAGIPSVSPQESESAFAAPSGAIAEDGAIEFTVPESPSEGKAAGAADALEFQAELALPGQPLVRVESAGYAAKSTRENSADQRTASRELPESPLSGLERIFENAAQKEVNVAPFAGGIAVAETDPTMRAAPIEEFQAVRGPQDPALFPGRAEFTTGQAPAERVPEPAMVHLAGRAVDTVTNLVDAQFSARMQRTGSVQLNLKFGAEDLSVRVEIRDGAVHTDFRTDSAPLRAALEREWQAVAAASPGQIQRYAEPVFSAGSGHSPTAGQGDARQQQQQQAQPDAQHRSPRESFSDHPAFNRRSMISESFVPEPAASRVASFLPTSLRLSALA